MPIIKNAGQDQAIEIEFDGAGSRLTSTNVKDAIVEASNPEPGWNATAGNFVVNGTGSTRPQWTEIGSTGMYAYNVSVDKFAWGSFSLPHDYKPNGALYMVIDYTVDGTDTRPVKWRVDYSIIKSHNQASPLFPAQTMYLESSPTGTALVGLSAESILNNTNAEPCASIQMKITRVTNGLTGNNDNNDNVFGLALHLQYETDRLATPNRTPNFYGV